jgi:flagellar basal body-associated protein FliL
MSELILRLSTMEIGVWVIVVLLGAVVYIVWHGSKFARDQRQSTMATLSSLGDTHRLGYQGLTLVVQRIEQRVKQLEERR